MTTWAHASSKLGRIQPATKSICKETFDAAQKAGHDVWFLWGAGDGEHGTGRAIDYMVKTKAAGDWVKAYTWKNRYRLRLQHIIWRQHIRSMTNTPGVDRGMSDRGNTTANHYDHNHILYNGGSYIKPKSVKAAAVVVKGKVTPKRKSTSTIAREVIAGKWGNGADRVSRLKRAGYDYNAIQVAVNKALRPKKKVKSTREVAREVIAGKWGDGNARVARLNKAGYSYTTIQKEVNRLL